MLVPLSTMTSSNRNHPWHNNNNNNNTVVPHNHDIHDRDGGDDDDTPNHTATTTDGGTTPDCGGVPLDANKPYRLYDPFGNPYLYDNKNKNNRPSTSSLSGPASGASSSPPRRDGNHHPRRPQQQQQQPSSQDGTNAVNPANVHALLAQQQQRRQRRPGNLVASALFAAAAAPPPTGGGSAPRKKQSTAQPRPTITVKPRQIGPVREPNANDVLSGRGGRINAHPGNVQFREIVAMRKKEYLAPETKKLEKAHIAADIVYNIRAMEPNGRFLKEDACGDWWDIGDVKAIKKVGQALREDAPDIRGDEIAPEQPEEDGMVYNNGNNNASGSSSNVSHDGSNGKRKGSKKRSSPNQLPSSDDDFAPATTKLVSSSLFPRITSEPSGDFSDATQPAMNHQDYYAAPPSPVRSTPALAGLVVQQKPKNSNSPSKKPIVSGRGGRANAQRSTPRHSNSAGSFQYQAEIDIRPPENYSGMLPPAPQLRSGTVAFRGGGLASGAAAAAMKHSSAVDMPGNNNSNDLVVVASNMDEAFGRQFCPPPADQNDSSLISGLSGPSAMSGVSRMSDLTDPISSSVLSNAVRAMRLDQTRQNWQQQHMALSSDSTATLQMLSASNGLGSSLNNSALMRGSLQNAFQHHAPQQQQQHPSHGHHQHQDDGTIMSLAGNSLLGGVDSPVFGGSVLSGTGSAGGFSISQLSAQLRAERRQRSRPHHPHNNDDGASMAAMSIASNGSVSMHGSIQSEVSDILNALDLAGSSSGNSSILEI